MISIQILCLDQAYDSAVAISCDVLNCAAQFAFQEHGLEAKISTVTLNGQPIETGNKQTHIPSGRLGTEEVDVLLVPGIRCSSIDEIENYLKHNHMPKLLEQLQLAFQRGTEIATACTGVWFVAEAGLLDGKQATTTWHMGMEFQQRFPTVDLQLGRMVTVDGQIRCAGSAMAHMDLAISVVTAHFGADVGRQVASLLLLDSRPSQSHYMIANHLSSKAEDFKLIDKWARSHISNSITIRDLAQGVGFSERTLARRIKDATGETPTQYLQRLRVNQAVLLLETSSLSFKEISSQLGYQEPSSLRKLIKSQTNRKPTDFRKP